MPWHPTVWPMVKGVNPWSSSRAVASLYPAHICRRVCRRYAGRLITTSPRQAIAGQVCCGSHAMPPTPLERLDSPNANPPRQETYSSLSSPSMAQGTSFAVWW